METREDKEYFIDLWKNCGCGTYVYAIIAFIVILALSSCATKTRIEYRDRDVNHYITNTVHDTLVEKSTDSVFVNKYIKGDTVFYEKYKEKTKWRDRVVEKHDTCYRDSIVTIKQEKTIEVVKIPKIFKISMVFSILTIIFA
mgnify:CR=1 FL=1